MTIDGSNSGGSSRDTTLTNINTGTASAVIWGQTIGTADSTTNNTIKNLNVSGNASLTTAAGIGFGSSTIGPTSVGTRNNNNRVENNSITTAQFGVISQGAQSAFKNFGTVITKNTLGGSGLAALGRAGIYAGFEDGIQVTNNTVAGVNSTFGGDEFGIALGSISISTTAFTTNNDVANGTVTGNFIGPVVAASNTGFSAAGISLGHDELRHDANRQQRDLRCDGSCDEPRLRRGHFCGLGWNELRNHADLLQLDLAHWVAGHDDSRHYRELWPGDPRRKPALRRA